MIGAGHFSCYGAYEEVEDVMILPPYANREARALQALNDLHARNPGSQILEQVCKGTGTQDECDRLQRIATVGRAGKRNWANWLCHRDVHHARPG